MPKTRATPGPGKPPVPIVVVDDHPLVRERLAELINREPDLAVVGEAADRHEATTTIAKTMPRLVIVDLKLRNSDGLELVKDVRSRWPAMWILVVSMYEESLYAERVIRAGAHGYITKQEATRRVIEAVRRVLSGNIYLNDRIASRIISRVAAGRETASATPPDLLADRELQVFELTGQGYNGHEIAAQLRITPKTVDTYRARVRAKLHLHGASELLRAAIAWSHRPPE